jgi:hypothetical protein
MKIFAIIELIIGVTLLLICIAANIKPTPKD